MQTFPDHVWRDIATHVEAMYPLEAAGVVVRGDSGAFEVINADPKSAERHRYELDPRLLLATRTRDQDIRAFYHSHPDGSGDVSQADLRAMYAGGSPSWPGVDWLIVGTQATHPHDVRQFEWDASTASYRSCRIGI